MKLATFLDDAGNERIGVVDPARGQILDLAKASGGADTAFASMLALIDAGQPGLARAQDLAAKWVSHATRPLAATTLRAPIPVPRQMRDSMVFELHLINAQKRTEERTGQKGSIPEVWYKQPIYYKCNRFAVNHPGADVHWPAYSTWMDFECEMATVIGKTGKDIQPDDAMSHIFGFTVFNDFSARDAQIAEMAGRLGPAKGKDFDGANALGPWIVTTDEIGADVHNLKMDARVNGERWGGGNSSSMQHKWPAILAHISKGETLYAGEVIGSGTVGTGCGLELGRQLQHGDIVELEIEKIGVLRNRVLSHAAGNKS